MALLIPVIKVAVTALPPTPWIFMRDWYDGCRAREKSSGRVQ
jgi:hypothetical protein